MANIEITDEVYWAFQAGCGAYAEQHGLAPGERVPDRIRAGLDAVWPIIAAQVLAGHQAPNGCGECATCREQDLAEVRAAVLAELKAAGRLLPEPWRVAE